MEMIGARPSSRLRAAIMGKNKSDVIDSKVFTHAGEIFDPRPWSWHPRHSWHFAGLWSAGPAP
ncbi:putative phosphoadenosine phosphosulfate sulfurtransferase [Arthrobacter sp. UYEF6]